MDSYESRLKPYVRTCVTIGNQCVLHRGFFLVPTRALNHGTVQSIIESKRGFPLPNDYNEIAYCLEWWGRGVDSHWQQDVLGLMYLCFQEQGTCVDKKNMFKFSIGMLHYDQRVKHTL
jgi:hypothetical protein